MTRRATIGLVLAVIVLLVGGSLWHSAADGMPSPGEFRQRVAATGLEVEWERNGGSGGVGNVSRPCGSVVVEISLRDDELWVSGASVPQSRLDEATAARIASCEP